MTRVTLLQEVRPMRGEELYARRQCRELTTGEAAEMLGGTARSPEANTTHDKNLARGNAP